MSCLTLPKMVVTYQGTTPHLKVEFRCSASHIAPSADLLQGDSSSNPKYFKLGGVQGSKSVKDVEVPHVSLTEMVGHVWEGRISSVASLLEAATAVAHTLDCHTDCSHRLSPIGPQHAMAVENSRAVFCCLPHLGEAMDSYLTARGRGKLPQEITTWSTLKVN